MGTSCNKQSSPQQMRSTIAHPSSYLLGHNRLQENFDTNQLNFIPDSDEQWDPPPPSPVLERPVTTYKYPISVRQLNYSNRMPIQQKYKCDQCGMVFPSDENLFRHKTRFCIGVKDSGIGRKPVYSDEEDLDDNSHKYTHRSTARKVIRHQSPTEKKREEVNEWKRQRSILQTVEDMEDRIVTDTHRTQRLTNHSRKQDYTYNDILLEYERLQVQERDVLRQMYNLQTQQTTLKYPDIQWKQMIDPPDKQLEALKRRNLRLEQERRIIQQKLEELISTNYQPTTIPNYEPYRFLHEMKEQQELNEQALDFLRRRLIYPNSSYSTVSGIPSLPYVNTQYTRLRRTGGDSVRNFRNTYLQSGGHDASVIARYSDIEYKLRTYDDYPWTKDYPEPLRQSQYKPERPADPTAAPPSDLTAERLKLANAENQRLQKELHDIHKKFDTLDTRTRQLELSVPINGHQHQASSKREPSPPPQPSFPESHSEQFNQRQTNQHISLPTLDKRLTPRASPAMSLLTSNMNRLRDPLAPQSYDPIGGFIIFFDFILHLPQTIEQCCLINCLHHPKSGLGEPSQLEPFKCDQYIDERNGDRMSAVLIATKQPVPRCPPQQALTVVIEVQTTTDKQTAVADLQTHAWMKLPLFDNKNRLLSGRWKVPLKATPIHHDESLAVISTLPTYEHAELYYRLVNSQDGDDQSSAPLSPILRDLYAYPLQYRNR